MNLLQILGIFFLIENIAFLSIYLLIGWLNKTDKETYIGN